MRKLLKVKIVEYIIMASIKTLNEYPYEDVVKFKHRCQYRLGPYENTSTDFDLQCAHFKCCRLGDRYNEIFEEKPTANEIHQFCKNLYIKGEMAKALSRQRKAEAVALAEDKGQIITINFDKKATIEMMMSVMNEIRATKYAWCSTDAIYAFEFFSKESPLAPENKHVHIATRRMPKKNGEPTPATYIAQLLSRKFEKNKDVYNVNGQERTWEIARDYVDGSCVSKSEGGDKWKYTKQDIEHREKILIDQFYEMYSN